MPWMLALGCGWHLPPHSQNPSATQLQLAQGVPHRSCSMRDAKSGLWVSLGFRVKI